MDILEFILDNKAPLITIILAIVGVVYLLFVYIQFRFKELSERVSRIDERLNKIFDKLLGK